MKNIKFFLYASALIFGIGFFTACEPDPVDIESPSISLHEGEGYIYSDTTLLKGSSFNVRVIATAGTNDLNLFGIEENGTKISLDRIGSGVNANPALTLGADAQGFDWEIGLIAQEDGLSEYSFYVEDVDGYTNAVKFTVAEVYEDIDQEVGGLLVYNFDGPLNGSLDLHVPEVVPSSDPNGDIQDTGIDTDLPLEQNWKQQIIPKNGASLYLPAEGLTYDGVDSKQKLKDAVDAGTELVISNVLNTGDIYLAKTPSLSGETSDYFLLRVDAIEVTKDNNEDYYEFTLKQALNM